MAWLVGWWAHRHSVRSTITRQSKRPWVARANTQDFIRLFSGSRCRPLRRRYGCMDYRLSLDYLDKWVAQGKALDVMIGGCIPTIRWIPCSGEPLDLKDAKFTRPVYPFPLRAQQRGKGDPNSASSAQGGKYREQGSRDCKGCASRLITWDLQVQHD